MGNPTGFLEIGRVNFERRPVEERIHDWKEVYKDFPEDKLKAQASRCMDCGIPFCHQGCPLGNIIPDWNDLVYRGQWQEALYRLLATNNFPEFTGRICPAPCEGSCVLGINADPVTIKNIEVTHHRSRVQRRSDPGCAGRKCAQARPSPLSAPARPDLAAAAQLNQAGHWVTVFERADRIGGLLRYGIPEFKMEKQVLDRRLNIMHEEGVMFRTNANVGVNVSVEELRREFDAILLAGGSTAPRDLPVPGRELKGIHFAMEYLPLQNKRCEGDDDFRCGIHQRERQTRRHHRRRRYRSRLPGHRSSSGRPLHRPIRIAARSRRRTRAGQSVAELAEYLPHFFRA